jgi:3-hydroxyisobutyrate dehydrogenase-like beta-hydroxyacid dehydrogenase
MAARYLAAGYTVYGEDRDQEEAQWLTEQGLRWASTPRAVAEAADIVMTSLPNDDVVGLSPQDATAFWPVWMRGRCGRT